MRINSLMFTTNLWQQTCLRQSRTIIRYLNLYSCDYKSKTLFDGCLRIAIKHD